jgi:hypothetical protein
VEWSAQHQRRKGGWGTELRNKGTEGRAYDFGPSLIQPTTTLTVVQFPVSELHSVTGSLATNRDGKAAKSTIHFIAPNWVIKLVTTRLIYCFYPYIPNPGNLVLCKLARSIELARSS